MKEGNVFPCDSDTLRIIREIEAYLGLKNKDIDKINYIELIEYINQVTLILLYK
jgi:hypothetical protein